MNALLVVILSGVLAAADPGCLERVEARRVANGWGLADRAAPDTVLIAVKDCSFLGHDGKMFVDGLGWYQVRVVDCQAPEDVPLASLGLVADVGGPLAEKMSHKWAVIVLGVADVR